MNKLQVLQSEWVKCYGTDYDLFHKNNIVHLEHPDIDKNYDIKITSHSWKFLNQMLSSGWFVVYINMTSRGWMADPDDLIRSVRANRGLYLDMETMMDVLSPLSPDYFNRDELHMTISSLKFRSLSEMDRLLLFDTEGVEILDERRTGDWTVFDIIVTSTEHLKRSPDE